MLTKNSELIVMRACGISLYRSALPLLLFALIFSGTLFELQERVLANSNREAARLNGIIRGYPMQTFGVFDRQWIIGRSGDIYHYDFFDPRANHFSRLSMFHLNETTWKLDSLIYAKEAVLTRQPGADGQAAVWTARAGWTREFSTAKPTRRRAERPVVKYAPFDRAFDHARAAGLFQDRRARGRSDDLQRAEAVHRRSCRPAAITSCPTWCSCSARSPSRSSR